MATLISIDDLSIFAVEPSMVQAEHLQLCLNNLGIQQVTRFADGRSILNAIQQNPPDVVISSMYLPDMTGGDLVQTMRNHDWGKKIAFVLISSETNPHYLEPVRQNGASAILRKPYQAEALEHALSASLDYLNPDPTEFNLGDEIDFDIFKVLLVDDSRVARGFIRQVLESLGVIHFTEAENGKQAAELVQQQQFDLVVTDYNMPEMDGRELTEFIRTRSMQTDIPILMVSSERNEGRLAAVQRAGVSGVCDKPFEPNIVKGLLQKMLLEH